MKEESETFSCNNILRCGPTLIVLYVQVSYRIGNILSREQPLRDCPLSHKWKRKKAGMHSNPARSMTCPLPPDLASARGAVQKEVASRLPDALKPANGHFKLAAGYLIHNRSGSGSDAGAGAITYKVSAPLQRSLG